MRTTTFLNTLEVFRFHPDLTDTYAFESKNFFQRNRQLHLLHLRACRRLVAFGILQPTTQSQSIITSYFQLNWTHFYSPDFIFNFILVNFPVNSTTNCQALLNVSRGVCHSKLQHCIVLYCKWLNINSLVVIAEITVALDTGSDWLAEDPTQTFDIAFFQETSPW